MNLIERFPYTWAVAHDMVDTNETDPVKHVEIRNAVMRELRPLFYLITNTSTWEWPWPRYRIASPTGNRGVVQTPVGYLRYVCRFFFEQEFHKNYI